MIARAAFLIVLLAASHAAAQSANATLSASVTPIARLSLSTNSLSFADADPDMVPLVPATSGPVLITAKARGAPNEAITLTVQAGDDLRSGIDVLPASLITWTGSGAGFVNGTLSAASPQLVASWVGSGVRNGSQNYFFANRWTHPSGIYSVTLIYTLSAP